MAYYGPEFSHVEDHGTTHLSVVDSEGSAVSLTSTVRSYVFLLPDLRIKAA